MVPLQLSVGVISPQDAVAAQRDVMENYHLHRPRALESSPAGSPISLQEEREGKQKHKLRVNEVLEGWRERGGVNYLFKSQVHFVSEEALISHSNGDKWKDTLTNSFNMASLHRVDV